MNLEYLWRTQMINQHGKHRKSICKIFSSRANFVQIRELLIKKKVCSRLQKIPSAVREFHASQYNGGPIEGNPEHHIAVMVRGIYY